MAVKQKILIVDDDNNIAELISLYLTKECFECMIVNDGESALKEFSSFRPDLVLLDLMLPGVDGYEVCRKIRYKSNTPIIMLSAKGEVFDKVLGLEMGADDYMIKPFDSKELVARVKAVLRRFTPEPAPTVSLPASAPAKIAEYPDLVINLTNYSGLPRKSNCCIFLLLSLIRSLPENSFWITSGDMNMQEIRGLSMFISRGSGKKSAIMRTGLSLRYGASATNLK